ncbi:MAG: GNAT family N-acetyltransferase [Chitinophagaceae bacterium]|jgi:GNAT superfamily N-acetyltransferase|nr:GNAT family N-acetyltransferase [Chitinophagaceae bacterium]
MNDALTISRAEENDLKIILALQKKCYLSEAVIYNDYNIEPLMQTLDSLCEEYLKGTVFLKGLINEKIVASVRGIIKEDTAYIGKLMVSANYQNNQLGQLMMKAIENYFDRCKKYELFTGHKSEKNLYLYKKIGYTKFSKKIVNENLTLIFLRKENSNTG